MVSYGKYITKHRKLILLIGVLLLIPSVLGIIGTRTNYDVLTYLPGDIETMEGQDILLDEFGIGGFSMVVVEGMDNKEVAALKEEIKQVDTVDNVIWYDSIFDLNVPMDILPEDLVNAFEKEDATVMAVLFSDSTSSDETMKAVEDIRNLVGENVFIGGMSALVTDIKDIAESETLVYVAVAALLTLVVLAFTMDSVLVPIFFLVSIGMSILYNLGSNIIFGEISYITKALAAVLQLGVTMDYSIFLVHSFEENKQRYPEDKERAMAHAISNTIRSVVGSSVTTIAGFLALCFMTFTLGLDLGLVMAKGVVFGVITCITILPSFILTFDRAIEKLTHREIIPDLGFISDFIMNHYRIFIVVFLVLLYPAIYGNNHTDVYYNLTNTLPDDLGSSIANSKLSEEFDLNTTHMLLVENGLDQVSKSRMLKELKQVDGVDKVLGMDSVVGPAIPQDMVPTDVTTYLKSENYELVLVASSYSAGEEECNKQITSLNKIVKSYSDKAMLIGEAPLTKDLIDITDTDFKTVSAVSIGIIFIIILVLFKSISLPIILVSVIEFAIVINMGLTHYLGTTIPFIASIVIGTIQLGATVDYAILMTTRYQKERNKGASKKEAIQIAHKASIKSVIASAFSFFAATFGVGLVSKIDMISSLCSLMSRGAIISMFVVLLILPSMFMVFDKVICKTTIGFGPKKEK